MKEDMPHEYQNKLLLPRRAMAARKTIKEKDIAKNNHQIIGTKPQKSTSSKTAIHPPS